MAKCQYSLDSGRNSYPPASCVDIHVQDRAWSVAGLVTALPVAGLTRAVATKAASFTNVTPNN
jgi:hypothetical protein